MHATSGDENVHSDTPNETLKTNTLDRTPLFKQFMNLSQKRAAPAQPPEPTKQQIPRDQIDQQAPIYKYKQLLQNIPHPGIARHNQIGHTTYIRYDGTFSTFVNMIEETKKCLLTENLGIIGAASQIVNFLPYVDYTDELYNQLTPDLLNPLAEICARLLTDPKYVELYPAYIRFSFFPMLAFNDTTVFDKYNVGRRILKLTNTSNVELLLSVSLEGACHMYMKYKNDQFFLKLLISLMPKIDKLGELKSIENNQVILTFLAQNAKSESPLMIDLYNLVKNKGPEFNAFRAFLAVWAFNNKHKAWKTWFQKREFDEVIKYAHMNMGRYRCLTEFLGNLYQCPEKIYDTVAIAKLCAEITTQDTTWGIPWNSHSAEYMLGTFIALFQLPNDGKNGSPPTKRDPSNAVPGACIMFEYFIDTMLAMIKKPDFPPPLRLSSALSRLFMYMGNNHPSELLDIIIKKNAHAEVFDVVKSEPIGIHKLQKIILFVSFITVPELKDIPLNRELYHALETVFTAKTDELLSSGDLVCIGDSTALEICFVRLKSAYSGNPLEVELYNDLKEKLSVFGHSLPFDLNFNNN